MSKQLNLILCLRIYFCVYMVYRCLCERVFACMCRFVHVCAYGGQKWRWLQPCFLIYGFSLNLECTNWVRPAGPKHQRPSYFASPVLGLMALGSIPGLLNVVARNPNSDLDAYIASSYCLPPVVSILF